MIYLNTHEEKHSSQEADDMTCLSSTAKRQHTGAGNRGSCKGGI